jgi:hypothetical protein
VPTLHRRLDSPAATAAVTFVLCLIFVLGRLAVFDWDASRFVQAGTRFVDPASAPSSLTVQPGTGFDGQFFYRLALNPFTSSRVEHGIELDIPALRHQRILYPALAWMFSGGGRPTAVPWALLGLNLAFMAAVGALSGAFARSTGRRALWGLVLSLYPGFAVTMGLDLAEIVATVFVLGCLLGIRRGSPAVAGLSLAAAVLTRETTMIVVAALAFTWVGAVLRRRPMPVSPVTFVPAVAVFIGVQAWLWSVWGEPPIASGGVVNIGVPFRKLASDAASWPDQGGPFTAYHWLLLGALIAFLVTVLRSVPASKALPHEKLTFILAAAIVPFLAGTIWLHYWAFLRALTELFLLGGVVYLSRPGARLDRFAVLTATLWLSVVLNMTIATARLAPPPA